MAHKTHMHLLLAVEEHGCLGIRADVHYTVLAFCEEAHCESYVAKLQASNDRRLLSAQYVLAVPVPDSGELDLDPLLALPGKCVALQ